MTLKTTAITAAVALGLGFAAGYDTKTRFAKADKFDAVVTTQVQTKQAVQQSLEQSTVIESKATASTQKISAIRKEVAARIGSQQHEVRQVESVTTDASFIPGWDACAWTLDVGTVGLLNAARTGADPGSAQLGDAEGKASSGLGPEDLIDNDLQVVEQYRDLAIRHDALVDYVESILKK